MDLVRPCHRFAGMAAFLRRNGEGVLRAKGLAPGHRCSPAADPRLGLASRIGREMAGDSSRPEGNRTPAGVCAEGRNGAVRDSTKLNLESGASRFSDSPRLSGLLASFGWASG